MKLGRGLGLDIELSGGCSSVREVQKLLLFPLLSLKNPTFTRWLDLKIWNTCPTDSSQLKIPYGVMWEGYMRYPPILAVAVCTGWGCSCHGKEERVRLGWRARGRAWLLTFEQSLRDERSKMQLLLQEGTKTSCWPLIWTGSLKETVWPPSSAWVHRDVQSSISSTSHKGCFMLSQKFATLCTSLFCSFLKCNKHL